MIGRIRGRRSFDALQREGRRARAGSLAVVFRPGASEEPCVAFSISRAVGTAVVRNRARRRLRAAFATLVRDEPQRYAPGHYLIVVRGAGWDYQQGATWLKSALQKVQP